MTKQTYKYVKAITDLHLLRRGWISIADDRVRGCIEDGRGHEEDGRAGDPEQVVGPGDGEPDWKRRGEYTICIQLQ